MAKEFKLSFTGSEINEKLAKIDNINAEDIIQQIMSTLATPVFGRVDENNNIILSGNLVVGTYALKYEDAAGNLIDIGTIKLVNSANDEGDGEGIAPSILIAWNEDYEIRTDPSNSDFGNPIYQESYSVTDIIDLEDSYEYTLIGTNWPAGNSIYPVWYTKEHGYIEIGGIKDGHGWNS